MSVAIIQRGDRATHMRASATTSSGYGQIAHTYPSTHAHMLTSKTQSHVFSSVPKKCWLTKRESDRERERERRERKKGERREKGIQYTEKVVPFIPYRMTADIVIAWVDLVRHRRRDRLNLLHKSIVRSFVPLNACTCNKGSE